MVNRIKAAGAAPIDAVGAQGHAAYQLATSTVKGATPWCAPASPRCQWQLVSAANWLSQPTSLQMSASFLRQS
jgi:hypothetical protein